MPEKGESHRISVAGVILRVDPDYFYRQVLQRLREYLSRKEEDELNKRIKAASERVEALAKEFIRPHTTLPSVIVPPTEMRKAFKVKVSSILSIAASHWRQSAIEVSNKFDRILSSRDIKQVEKMRELIDQFFTDLIVYHIALRIAIDSIVSICAMNAPAEVRPPLVNICIGYDIIGAGGGT